MHLNHWTEEAYNEALTQAGLHVEKFEDITENVIRGFMRYPFWLKTMKKRNVFSDTMLKTFYSVNVRTQHPAPTQTPAVCYFFRKTGAIIVV